MDRWGTGGKAVVGRRVESGLGRSSGLKRGWAAKRTVAKRPREKVWTQEEPQYGKAPLWPTQRTWLAATAEGNNPRALSGHMSAVARLLRMADIALGSLASQETWSLPAKIGAVDCAAGLGYHCHINLAHSPIAGLSLGKDQFSA